MNTSTVSLWDSPVTNEVKYKTISRTDIDYITRIYGAERASWILSRGDPRIENSLVGIGNPDVYDNISNRILKNGLIRTNEVRALSWNCGTWEIKIGYAHASRTLDYVRDVVTKLVYCAACSAGIVVCTLNRGQQDFEKHLLSLGFEPSTDWVLNPNSKNTIRLYFFVFPWAAKGAF